MTIIVNIIHFPKHSFIVADCRTQSFLWEGPSPWEDDGSGGREKTKC